MTLVTPSAEFFNDIFESYLNNNIIVMIVNDPELGYGDALSQAELQRRTNYTMAQAVENELGTSIGYFRVTPTVKEKNLDLINSNISLSYKASFKTNEWEQFVYATHFVFAFQSTLDEADTTGIILATTSIADTNVVLGSFVLNVEQTFNFGV